MARTLLVVEDNQDIARLIALHLADAGYRAALAHDGRAALAQVERAEHELVILDLMLPDMDGTDLLRRLRARPTYVPVLILTSKSSELDRVLGLELGADDYVTKPFSVLELVARVKAILRRGEALRQRAETGAERIHAGDLVIDRAARKVLLGDAAIELTPREFDLLLCFARSPGRVYTRAELLDRVWGQAHMGYEHTVNSHINRLRAKIEADPTRPRYLLTVWGVGYKFAAPGGH
jgi:DNA-binding response OmpR family regulator